MIERSKEWWMKKAEQEGTSEVGAGAPSPSESPRAPVEHDLKTWPEVFDDVREGRKPFEIRKNDRDFRVGDTLLLREWDPVRIDGSPPRGYSGRSCRVRVTYILGGAWLPNGLIAMTVERMGQPSPSAVRLAAYVLAEEACLQVAKEHDGWANSDAKTKSDVHIAAGAVLAARAVRALREAQPTEQETVRCGFTWKSLDGPMLSCTREDGHDGAHRDANERRPSDATVPCEERILRARHAAFSSAAEICAWLGNDLAKTDGDRSSVAFDLAHRILDKRDGDRTEGRLDGKAPERSGPGYLGAAGSTPAPPTERRSDDEVEEPSEGAVAADVAPPAPGHLTANPKAEESAWDRVKMQLGLDYMHTGEDAEEAIGEVRLALAGIRAQLGCLDSDQTLPSDVECIRQLVTKAIDAGGLRMADVSLREDYERVYVQMKSLVGDLRRQLAAAQELIDAEPGLRPPHVSPKDGGADK